MQTHPITQDFAINREVDTYSELAADRGGLASPHRIEA